MTLSCPVPSSRSERILLGHGSGGQLTAELLDQVFLRDFRSATLARREDQAIVALGRTGTRIAFSTDAFVANPIFFPGGDVGKLAVHGTVNDLAVGGAFPVYLAAAFILEEGLLIADLSRIVASMREACAEANVELVTGDTKVVERGKGDQVFITTSGIGLVPDGRALSIAAARPGDHVLVSGTVGDHGIAMLSVREGLEFETELRSDTAPLHDLAQLILEICPNVRCMRDPTRGGLATVLNELASASEVGIRIAEATVPVRPEVRAACEMLGLDPLHVASEGRLVAVVPREDADRALAAMRAHPKGRVSCRIGEIVRDDAGTVVMTCAAGSSRVLTPLLGEQLPRIC